MATLFQVPQFLDGNGNPLAGGKLYWYISGTTTFQDTWVDQAESSTAPNPIILDNQGRVSTAQNGIWIRGSYKLKITDSADVTVPAGTLDNINEYDQVNWTGLTASIADINSTNTISSTKIASYTITLADRNTTILADATSGALNLNLPDASVVGEDYRIYLKKIDVTSNVVTVVTVGAQTIDGFKPAPLADYNDGICLQSDGSNWFRLSDIVRGTTTVVAITSNIKLSQERTIFLADASAGAIILTLPAAASIGSGYRVKIKKTEASGNSVTIATPGAETIDGLASLVMTEHNQAFELVTDDTNWYIENYYTTTLSVGLPTNFITGLMISNSAGDAVNDVSISAGKARDSGDNINIVLSSPLIKRSDANWTQGGGVGGFPTALTRTVGVWYHVFVIAKADGTVDGGYDTSLTATNLLADASLFTYYKRVGAIRYIAGTIAQFVGHEDTVTGTRSFYWLTPDVDLFRDTYADVADNVSVLVSTFVPAGLEIKAILHSNFVVAVSGVAGDTMHALYSPSRPSIASLSTYTATNLIYKSAAEAGYDANRVEVFTNIVSQVKGVMVRGAGITGARAYILTVGWEE